MAAGECCFGWVGFLVVELAFRCWMKFSGLEMEACWGVELRGCVDRPRVLVVVVELSGVRVLLWEFRLV